MSVKWLSHAYVELLLNPTILRIPSDPTTITAPFDLAITWIETPGGRAFLIYDWAYSFDPCEGLAQLQAAFPGEHVKGAYVAKGQKWGLLDDSADPANTHFCS